MGKKIRLTEAELHGLVERAVKNVIENEELNEGWMDYFKSLGRDTNRATQNAYNSASNKVKQGFNNVSNKVQQGYNNAVDKMKQGYDNVSNKIQQGYNNAKQGMQNMHNRAMDAKVLGDIPSAIQTLDAIKQRGLIQGRNLAMVNGAITILNNLLAQSREQA